MSELEQQAMEIQKEETEGVVAPPTEEETHIETEVDDEDELSLTESIVSKPENLEESVKRRRRLRNDLSSRRARMLNRKTDSDNEKADNENNQPEMDEEQLRKAAAVLELQKLVQHLQSLQQPPTSTGDEKPDASLEANELGLSELAAQQQQLLLLQMMQQLHAQLGASAQPESQTLKLDKERAVSPEQMECDTVIPVVSNPPTSSNNVGFGQLHTDVQSKTALDGAPEESPNLGKLSTKLSQLLGENASTELNRTDSGMLYLMPEEPPAPADTSSASLNPLLQLQHTAEKALQQTMKGASFLVNGEGDGDAEGRGDGEHSGAPGSRHRCRFCDKIFGSDSALQIHIRSHTGERPFKCNVCGNRFSTKGNLKVHFQRHAQKWPHVQMNSQPVPEHLDRFHPPLEPPGSSQSPPPTLPPTTLTSVCGNLAPTPVSSMSMIPTSTESALSGAANPLLLGANSDNPAAALAAVGLLGNALGLPFGSLPPAQMRLLAGLTPELASQQQLMGVPQLNALSLLSKSNLPTPNEESEQSEDSSVPEESRSLSERSRQEAQAAPAEPERPFGQLSSGESTEENNQALIDYMQKLRTQSSNATASTVLQPNLLQLLGSVGGKNGKELSESAINSALMGNPLEQLAHLPPALAAASLLPFLPPSAAVNLLQQQMPFFQGLNLSGQETGEMEHHSSEPASPAQRVSPSNKTNSLQVSRSSPSPVSSGASVGAHQLAAQPAAAYQDLLPKPGSTDNAWESLMEVEKANETSKLAQLVEHMDQKVQTEPNQCIICQRVLSCKSALQMHYRTHTGERPFKCKICGRAFTTKGNLKTHMSVHRVKPPLRVMHECAICQQQFTNALVLQQHVKLHAQSGETRMKSSTYSSPAISTPSGPFSLAGFSPGAHMLNASGASNSSGSQNLNGASSTMNGLSAMSGMSGPTSNQSSLNDEEEQPEDVDGRKDFEIKADEESSRERPFGHLASATIEQQFGMQLQQMLTREAASALDFSRTADEQKSVSSARSSSPPRPISNHGELEQNEDSMTSNLSSTSGALDLTPKQQQAVAVHLQQLKQATGSTGGPTSTPTARSSANTTCQICMKTFACNSALEIHYRSHTKERPFKCSICARGFSTKGNMKQHMLTHKIRDFPPAMFGGHAGALAGAVAGSATSPLSALVPAMAQVGTAEQLGQLKEKLDLAGVLNANGLSENCLVNASLSSLAGSIAGLSGRADSPMHSERNRQSIRVSGETSGAGDESSNATASGSSGDLKHMCDICVKPFSSHSALQIHNRTHTGDRPFKCNICARAFTTKGNLKVHMGTHMWSNAQSRRGRRMSIDVPFATYMMENKNFGC